MTGEELSPAARAAAQMQLIGARALTSNLRRVDELTTAVGVASSDGALSDASLDAAVGLAHQLAGSAGTFGFERVSRLARRLEQFLLDQSFVDAQGCAAASEELALMRVDLLAGPDDDGYLT